MGCRIDWRGNESLYLFVWTASMKKSHKTFYIQCHHLFEYQN
jgi:hypothetical protein